ncbi:hypothetical protein HYH02_001697 [Chlamydomonas schloesseri]|uniref:Guanylate cyclase domain-containing protein n=1 Tax=Chlamydomonas schloesseri TaxID=2026947 RepID=A0A835WTQ1_9CHLO|nr:hypothetical protein HYH02_001697 [Chlamydomonas schloesseri]|eukprot:KAG2453476.1 hypothetical protein HYH02_001697 [Chlamydomonas schloesseri]
MARDSAHQQNGGSGLLVAFMVQGLGVLAQHESPAAFTRQLALLACCYMPIDALLMLAMPSLQHTDAAAGMGQASSQSTGGGSHDVTATALLYFAAAHALMAAQACCVALWPARRQAARVVRPPALVLPLVISAAGTLPTAPSTSLRRRTSAGNAVRTPQQQHLRPTQEEPLLQQLPQQDDDDRVVRQEWVAAQNRPVSRSALRSAAPGFQRASADSISGDVGGSNGTSRAEAKAPTDAPVAMGAADLDQNGVAGAMVQRPGPGLNLLPRMLLLPQAEPANSSSAVDSSGSVVRPAGLGVRPGGASAGSGNDTVAAPRQAAAAATPASAAFCTSGDGYMPPEPTSMPSRTRHSFPVHALPAVLSTPADRLTVAADGSSAVSAPGAASQAAAANPASLPQLRILSDTQAQSSGSHVQHGSAAAHGCARTGVEDLISPVAGRTPVMPSLVTHAQPFPADSSAPQQQAPMRTAAASGPPAPLQPLESVPVPEVALAARGSATSQQRSLQQGGTAAATAAAAAVLGPRHSGLRQRHSLGPRRSGGSGGMAREGPLTVLSETVSGGETPEDMAMAAAAALELWLARRGLACAMAAVLMVVYLWVLIGGPGNAVQASLLAMTWHTLLALPSLLCLAALAAANGAAAVSALLLGGRPLELGPLAGLFGPCKGASSPPHNAAEAAAQDVGGHKEAPTASQALPLATLLRWEVVLRTALPAAMAVAARELYGPESPCSTDHVYLWMALQPATGEVASPLPWAAGQKPEASASAVQVDGDCGGSGQRYPLLPLTAVLPMQLATALAARAAHTLLAGVGSAAGIGAGQAAAAAAGKPGFIVFAKALLNVDPRHLPEYGLGAVLALVLRAVLLRGCAMGGVVGLQPELQAGVHDEPQRTGGDDTAMLDAEQHLSYGTAPTGALGAETGSLRSAPSTRSSGTVLAAGGSRSSAAVLSIGSSSRKLLLTGSGVSNPGSCAQPSPGTAALRPALVATSAAHIVVPSPRSPASGPQPFSSPLVQVHASSPSARSPHAAGPDGLQSSSTGGPWDAAGGPALPTASTVAVPPQSPSTAAAAVQARMARRAPPRSSSFNLRLSLSYGSQVLASALSPLAVGAIAALRDATGGAAPPTPTAMSCRQSATSVISEQLEALLDLKRLSTASSVGPSAAGASTAAVAAAAAAAAGAEVAGHVPYVRARSARRRRGSNASVDNGGIALYRQQLGTLLAAAGSGGATAAAASPRHGASPSGASRLSGMHADLRGGWASDALGDDGEDDEDFSEEGIALALQAAELGTWGRRQHGSMPALAAIMGGGSSRSRSRPGSSGGGFSASTTPRSPLHRAGEAPRSAAAPAVTVAAAVGERCASSSATPSGVMLAACVLDSSLSRRSLRKLASMPSRLRSSAAAAAATAAVAAVDAEAGARAGYSSRTGDGGTDHEPTAPAGKGNGGPLCELWRRQRAAAAAAAAASAPQARWLSRSPQVHAAEEAVDLRQDSRDGLGSGGAASPVGLAVELGLAAAAAASGATAGASGSSRASGAATGGVPLTSSALGAEQDLRREALRSLVLAKWRSSLAAGIDGSGGPYGLAPSPLGAAAGTGGGFAPPAAPQGTYVAAEGAAAVEEAGEDATFEDAMLSDPYGALVSMSAVLGTTGTLGSPRVSAAGGNEIVSGSAAGVMSDFGLSTSPPGHGAVGAGMWTARSTAAAAAALAEVAAAADELVVMSPRSGGNAGSAGGGAGGGGAGGLAAAAFVMSPQLSGMLSLGGTAVGTGGNASALTGNSRRSLGLTSRNTSIKTSILSRNSSINYGQPGGAAASAGVLGLLSTGVSTKSLLSSGAAAASTANASAAGPADTTRTLGTTAAAKALGALQRWWLLRGAPLLEAAWLGEAGALLLQLAFSPHVAKVATLSEAGRGLGGAAWAWLAWAPQAACVAHLAALAAVPDWCEAWGPTLWAARAMLGPALQRGALAALGVSMAPAGPLQAAWEAAYMTAALRLTAPQHGSLVLATTAALALVTLTSAVDADGGVGNAVGALCGLEAALRHAAGLLAASTVGAALGLLAARALPASAAGLLTSSALRRRLSPPRAAAAALWSATLIGDSEATATGAVMTYLLVARAALLRVARMLRAVAAAVISAALAAAGAMLTTVFTIAGSTTSDAATGTLTPAPPMPSSYNLRWRLRRWLVSSADTATAATMGMATGGSGAPDAAGALVAALPSRTPAAVAVGALVALLVALAAGQALLLAALTGDGRRVSRFHRRQAALVGLKARLLAAPTVLELLTELTMSTDQLLEGCSAWAVIVPTSDDVDVPGSCRGGSGATASSGVLLELRLHPDLQLWPARTQSGEANGPSGASGSAAPSPAVTAAVAAAERDRQAEKRQRAEQRRMQMLRRRQPRPPSRTGAAPQPASADSVAREAAGAGKISGNATSGAPHLVETVTSIAQEDEEESEESDDDDAYDGDSTEDTKGNKDEGQLLPEVASFAAAGASAPATAEAAGEAAGRAPAVQLADFPSLQLAMIHRTICAANGCLAQPYGLMVVATAHPAAADRYLRLLCQGLADGLAQALYLKQLQADVAASDMIMQDIYPSQQVVQVVKRRFHAAGAASQRLMMPGSATAAAAVAAAAAAGSGSPAANSLSGFAIGGSGGPGSTPLFAAGVKAPGGAGSYAASPNASAAGVGAVPFRSPVFAAHPQQHHLASVSSPSCALTALPRFGSSTNATAAATAVASAGASVIGGGLVSTAPGSGPDSAGPARFSHAGPLLEAASMKLSSTVDVDVTCMPVAGLLASSQSVGAPIASPGVPGGSTGSGPGSATAAVGAHGRALYAAMASAFTGPASTLGGMMSFGRADSAPVPAAALVSVSAMSAAPGLGHAQLGASRLSLDPHVGTSKGASRSQTITPSQAAAVAAAAGLGAGVSNSTPGGPVSMGSGPSPLPAVAAVASALAPGLRPVSVSVAGGMGEGTAGVRGSPMASISGFFSTSVAAAAAAAAGAGSMAGPSVGATELTHGSGLSTAFAAALESGSAFGSVGGSQQRTVSGVDNDAGVLPVGVPYARWHSAVSVLFADICGYTATSQALAPEQVMALLHTLFCKYDSLLAAYGVYKVETIGDCFMAATGLEVESDGHALDMVRFGRAMIAAAAEVANPVTGEPLQIRVGIHSGRVMSGIVGQCRARYCLFGDTVNTASRLESTGVPGRIQIAEETFVLLPEEERNAWVSRGPVEMKGKGAKQTYLSALAGSPVEQLAAPGGTTGAVQTNGTSQS